MSKIPKRLAKLHGQAMALVRAGRPLTLDEREFVLENFHEGAEHMNGLAGAFFTPARLARDFAIEARGRRRVLDLCAGIGALSYAVADEDTEVVCVELNAAYVEVGRAVMPSATWIHASAFDVAAFEHLGPFDIVISNPPFGQIKGDGYSGAYTGGLFEFRVIETASRLAPYGVFIVPQQSAPFRYSGQPSYRVEEDEKCRRFREQTGIVMEASCGIDTAAYLKDWRGVSPTCEIVCCDFSERAAVAVVESARESAAVVATGQLALFGDAA